MILSALGATLFVVAGHGQAPGSGTATISGTVTSAATGQPVVGASIIIRRHDAAPSDPTVSTRTDERGRYRSPGLAAGDYSVEAWPPRSSPELMRLIYKAHPCPYTGCPAKPRDVVAATVSNETRDIDFVLPVGGSISGRVVDAARGQPLPQVLITARSDAFNGRAVSGDGGRFTIHALISGSYAVEARPAWDGLLGAPPQLVLRLEQMLTQRYREPVVVMAPASVTAIDFALEDGGRISGTVTEARTGRPIAGLHVQVNGNTTAQARTDAQGRYEAPGLPTGTYSVFVLVNQASVPERPALPFADQLYKGIPCAARTCWDTKGAPVRVRATQTTANIDFALEPRTR